MTDPARILISALPGELRAACLKDGRLQDLLVLRADRPSLLGNIYQGRVLELSDGLDAAFVDVGLEAPGLLPRGEAPGRKQLGRALSEGDAVTVRVVREASENKGVRLTSRITNPPENLERLADEASVPALVYQGEDPLKRFILCWDPVEAIVVDDSEVFKGLQKRLTDHELHNILTFDPGLRPLLEREGAEEQIEALLSPEVPLPGGGSLLIEPVRTLTAIDVNLGSMSRGGSAQAQTLAVNLEAAEEIARQLRLRAISGLIVVDFLELKSKAGREKVVAALRAALEADSEPSQLRGMSASGLLEMTRRRGAPTLAELLTDPAGEQGSGRHRNTATLAFDALRQVRSEAEASPGCPVEIRASEAVVLALREGVAAAARKAVEARLGQEILLVGTPSSDEKSGGAVEILVHRR